MNIEEIKQSIHNSFNDYKLDMCENGSLYVFNRANDIAKMEAIYNFLIDAPEEFAQLAKLADKVVEADILYNLFAYECGYDNPMWNNWEDLKKLVKSFLIEPADENEVEL